jgi:putative transcriptional regulator
MTKTYRSKSLAALHENVSDLYHAGVIPLIKLTPAAIRRIRAKAEVSQAVFAAHLNVTTGIVSKWERGEKEPSGPAAKLLTLVAVRGIEAIA